MERRYQIPLTIKGGWEGVEETHEDRRRAGIGSGVGRSDHGVCVGWTARWRTQAQRRLRLYWRGRRGLVDGAVLTKYELTERLALVEAGVADHLDDVWPFADAYGMAGRGRGNMAEFGPHHGPAMGAGPVGNQGMMMDR